MTIGRFTQDPDEKKRYTVDYSQWLSEGETITDSNYTTETISGTGTITISDDAIDTDGTLIEYFASGGVTGSRYIVTITIQTSIGQIKQDKVEFRVEAI